MTPSDPANYNVSRHLADRAYAHPDKVATILANGRRITFGQMERETQRLVHAFSDAGIEQGMRVATFVRPGLDFVPAIFALFRLGAVPVFIDPGMKVPHMLACLKEVDAKAIVGIPLAHLISRVFKTSFSSVTVRVLIGTDAAHNRMLGARIISSVVPELRGNEPFANSARNPSRLTERIAQADRDTPAAILFTSGSTGVPKGVEVTHGILDGQTEILRKTFDITPNDVDLVPFPLFALFSAAWGITAIIPQMNPAKPAQVNGRKLAELIRKHDVTHTAGSPAIWKRLFRYCLDRDIRLPSLRRILMAGAPVPKDLLEQSRHVLAKNAYVHTPYGATEALPVTSIRSDELLSECLPETANGRGTCVGRPLDGVRIRIIEIVDGPVEHIDACKPQAAGQIGEVIVQGPLVTRSYFNRPQSTRLAKIADGDQFWHRMGDLGFLDESGRLWFCGRKDHRVHARDEMYPVQCEGIFNQHPDVERTAVVGVRTSPNRDSDWADEPVLVVQPRRRSQQKKLRKELLAMAQSNPLTANIKQVFFRPSFPVDVRHNIKINRPKLAKYAEHTSNSRSLRR